MGICFRQWNGPGENNKPHQRTYASQRELSGLPLYQRPTTDQMLAPDAQPLKVNDKILCLLPAHSVIVLKQE